MIERPREGGPFNVIGFGILLAGIASIASLVGCSTGSSPAATADSGAPEDVTAPTDGPGTSVCGRVGDQGNSLGVGQYCAAEGTCPASASLCSAMSNATAPANLQSYFCTLACDECSPAGFCGTGASCVCNVRGCGCVPDTCPALIPDAGNPPCVADAGADTGVDGRAESGVDSGPEGGDGGDGGDSSG